MLGGRVADKKESMRRAVLTLAMVLVAAGCGSATSASSSSPTAKQAAKLPNLSEAAATTRSAGSARVDMHMTTTADGREVTMHGVGAIDFGRPQKGDLRMTMSVPTVPVPLQMHEIVDGLVVYIDVPLLSGSLPSAKPWIKLDLGKIGRQAGVNLGSIIDSSNNDPSQALSYLTGASSNVQNLGTDTIRGVQTTHYRAAVDLEKVVAHAPAGDRKALRKTVATLRRQLGSTTFPVDVWIDSAGRARRISEKMSMPALAANMSMTEDLYDFGVKVNVTPPPADQTIGYLEFMRSLGQNVG
jgi:hypothetical protein